MLRDAFPDLNERARECARIVLEEGGRAVAPIPALPVMAMAGPVLRHEMPIMAGVQGGLFTPLGQGDVDILGVVQPQTTTDGELVRSMAPVRALTPTALAAGGVRTVKVVGVGGVPANAKSVLVNLISTNTVASGSVVAWSSGWTRPSAPNLNTARGSAVSNLALVPIGADGTVKLSSASNAIATLGAIDTGAFVLAQARLLRGHPVTLHWEAQSAFKERFPAITVTQELFEWGERRISCAGGTAAMDMVLALIGQRHGQALAIAEAHLQRRGAGVEGQVLAVDLLRFVELGLAGFRRARAGFKADDAARKLARLAKRDQDDCSGPKCLPKIAQRRTLTA